MMMDKDTDSSKVNDSQPFFVVLNFEATVEEDIKAKVRRLGGEIVENALTWDPRVTHVINRTFVKSEIVLAGKC